MSEKHLTEASWKSFVKGHDYKDALLVKALAALAKSDKGGADAQLAALDDLEKQAEILRKANKADKDLIGYLNDLDKALLAERKSVQQAKQQQPDDSDDEAESPVLLTTKMIPLLREVRKGELVLQALIAVVGKDTAVLVSRRAISPARGKLLKEFLGASGAVKFIRGECIFEANAHTFVVQSQAAGLAKKLKAALLAQTELRLKVRVRGEDPDDLDEVGEEDGDNADASGAPKAAAAAPAAKDAPAPSAAAETYAKRLAALTPLVEQAVADKRADGAKLRALLDFAKGKAAGGDHAAAVQGLQALEKVLNTAPAAAGAAEGGGVDPAAAFNARLTALMPKVRDAITGGGPQASAVKQKAGEAGIAAKGKDFKAAQALLDDVESLLGQQAAPAAQPAAADQAAAAGDGAGTQEADYTALLQTLQPQFDAATAAGLPPELADQVTQLRRAWDLAQEAAEGGNFERALVILRRLADGGLLGRIGEARRAGGTPGQDKPSGVVAQRKFMLTRWARIPAELKVELQGLKQMLEQDGTDDDPGELTNAIDEHLQDLLADLQDQLDAAISAGNMAAFKGLRQRVEQDSVIGHLMKAPFMDGTKFKQATLDAMDEIEAALAE